MHSSSRDEPPRDLTDVFCKLEQSTRISAPRLSREIKLLIPILQNGLETEKNLLRLGDLTREIRKMTGWASDIVTLEIEQETVVIQLQGLISDLLTIVESEEDNTLSFFDEPATKGVDSDLIDDYDLFMKEFKLQVLTLKNIVSPHPSPPRAFDQTYIFSGSTICKADTTDLRSKIGVSIGSYNVGQQEHAFVAAHIVLGGNASNISSRNVV
jgi:hypothetical protein